MVLLLDNYDSFVFNLARYLEELGTTTRVERNDALSVADIERLNALRNGIAHAFFPENLRSSKPSWKGKDIFSLEGVAQFMEDLSDLQDFFLRKMKAW